MYYEGQGVSRDEERPLHWIERAADNGSKCAVRALGELAGMGRDRLRTAPPERPENAGNGPADL